MALSSLTSSSFLELRLLRPLAPAPALAPAQVMPTDDVISVPSKKKMMRDKHEFTGNVNIPFEAYNRRYDRQFLRSSITGRQICNTLHGVHTLMCSPRSRQRLLC
jgi:hypothetical protein